MRWVKMRACCVFLAFLLAFLLTNLTKAQPQRIGSYRLKSIEIRLIVI